MKVSSRVQNDSAISRVQLQHPPSRREIKERRVGVASRIFDTFNGATVVLGKPARGEPEGEKKILGDVRRLPDSEGIFGGLEIRRRAGGLGCRLLSSSSLRHIASVRFGAPSVSGVGSTLAPALRVTCALAELGPPSPPSTLPAPRALCMLHSLRNINFIERLCARSVLI